MIGLNGIVLNGNLYVPLARPEQAAQESDSSREDSSVGARIIGSVLFSASPALLILSLFAGCSPTTNRGSASRNNSEVRINNDGGSLDYRPPLVWTGREYGLAWDDDRDANREIYFRRIQANGVTIGQDVRITHDPARSERPSLVWTGQEYGLVWENRRQSQFSVPREIYFRRVRADGVPIGQEVEIHTTRERDLDPAISLVWNEQAREYGLVWSDDCNDSRNNEIYFRRLREDGTIIGSEIRVTNNNAFTYGINNSKNPSLVWTGEEYGIAWLFSRYFPHSLDSIHRDFYSNIYFARLSTTGARIGDSIEITNNLTYSSPPSLAWNGQNREYGISWSNNQDRIYRCERRSRVIRNIHCEECCNHEIYFRRVREDGVVTGLEIQITSDDERESESPFLVWNGNEYGIVWADTRDSGGGSIAPWRQIYFRRLQADGRLIGSEVRITSADGTQVDPSLVWAGSEYGMAWYRGSRNTGIYFRRILVNIATPLPQ